LSKIELITKIEAPLERCFKLSTSIDLHKVSASQTKEEAIEGVTHGLIKLNETVTWRAKHFGFWHKMKVQITQYEEPNFFVDEMLEGSFKFMKHKHEFINTGNHTIMKDVFEFSSPFGLLGKIIDKFILEKYMTQFLKQRNITIKRFAETEDWKKIL